MGSDLPIGIFDSGVGGLTVLAAIARRLPGENLLYLGDTARVPYGTRSPETVERYAHRVAGHLYEEGIKALVVACNTATTWAIDSLIETGARLGVPVIGVIEPGVQAALTRTANGHVAIIGTEGTVQGGRYEAALRARRPDLKISAIPCPLFVSLAEEGWTDDPIAHLVAERYLAPLRDGPDTLILGCTHFPLLATAIGAALPGVALVDSGEATAEATASLLAERGLLRRGSTGARRYLVTDNLSRFHNIGSRILHGPPQPAAVVDLDDNGSLTWRNAPNPVSSPIREAPP